MEEQMEEIVKLEKESKRNKIIHHLVVGGITTFLPAILVGGSIYFSMKEEALVKVGATKIKYTYDKDNNEYKYKGTISYDDLDNISLITVENNGNTKTLLMTKKTLYHKETVEHKYFNLVNGTKMFDYYTDKNEETIYGDIDDNFKILNDEPIINYLFEADYIKNNYEVKELVDFYYDYILVNKETKKLVK